jgi:predicted secreted hydrolase
MKLELTLRSAKPPVFHGADGVSQKAAGAGRASHYYSLTRLVSEGTVTLDGEEFAVEGMSWFDHEWATNQLGENQVGWDWLSLAFDDGTELMLFQIRERDGGRSAYSSGTFVRADGTSEGIGEGEFTMVPGREWTGPETGAVYPVEWRVTVPKLGLELAVAARMDGQEQVLEPISYWEGSVRASSEDGTKAGLGYLEMTGYGSEIVGMSAVK